MNVLHFCMSRGWGGLEMASHQWARIFQEQGHKSFSICYPGSPLAAKLAQSQLATKEMAFKAYFSPKKSKELSRFIVQNDIQAVFLQSLKDLWVVVPALWFLPKNHPCKLIGFAQMWLQGINKKDFLHTLIHKRMDALITLTPRQSEQVLRCIPFEKENTHVIPNSINTKRFSPSLRSAEVRKEFGAQENDILIGLVGRIDRQKGQKELLEAFALSRKRTPHLPLKLVLVGDPTPDSGESYLQSLKDTLTKNKLENDVILAGFREDIPRVMSCLDIFVLNSYQEAFGFVMVEAMASGTAVIATNSGGVPDILQNGKYGWLVPPKDVNALSDTLTYVANETEKRKTMALTAREYACNEFDELKNFEKILNLAKGKS